MRIGKVLTMTLALALAACAGSPGPVPQAVAPAMAAPAPAREAVKPAPVQAPAPASDPAPAQAPAPARPVPAHPAPATASEAPVPAAPRIHPPAPFEQHGRVLLQAGRGQQVQPGEAVDTVVYFVPDAGMPPPRARRLQVVTADRDFRPGAVVVPQGSTVRYANQDSVRHNVFSVTPRAAFNLGFTDAGASVEHVFDTPGLVLVSCNVHRAMEMDVFVVPSPYASRVGADGRFTLRGLPPGPGQLVAWNPRGRLARQSVALPASAPVSVSLLAERPRVVTEIDVGSRP